MGEYTAGSASVPITPDFRDFHSQIAGELDTLDAQFAEAGDKSGKTFASAFQDQLKASFADLPDAVIKASADTADADAELADAAKTRTATVKVNVDKSSLDQAKSALSGIQESAGKLVPSAVSAAAFTGVALGPQALGAAVGAAGIGVALGAAAIDAGAFGAIAVPMFTAVTKAQAALTKAQQEYAKATTSAQVTKALADEKAALAGLTPAERDLLTQLTALEAGWKKLSQAQQPVVEGALTPWLQTAQDGMRLLNPLITGGANAIQFLGSEADTAIKSPFWDKFSTTLGQTGEDALTAFGTAAGSVGDGLAHLFVTFAPDIDKLLSDVPQLGTDFDNWAKSVKAGGLEDFFGKTFSHSNLSTLKGDLDNVGTFFKNVASATESMSPLAFNGLSVLLQAIGLLPPGAVIALTGLFLATKTIGAIGNIAGLAQNVIGLGKAAVGLLGGAATTAETAAEGTAAGTAGGTAAATAFTGAFSTELNLALPTAFVSIGTTVATAADAAGTVWGTAAATTFGTAFAAEDALGVTAAMTAVGTEAAVEAGVAGAEIGTALAGGFATSLGTMATALAAALPEAGLVAVLAAGVAGAALGTAVGLGFTLALAATGVTGAAGKIGDDVKSATSQAGTWLTPAGQDTVKGYITGFDSQQAAATQAAGQLKGWVNAGAPNAQTWLTPQGQAAPKGFNDGFTSLHSQVNSTAAQLKGWITDTLPSDSLGHMLGPAGVSVVQGLANGIISATGLVRDAVASIASLIPSTLSGLLGINSPAKVMIPLGSAVPEGVGVGMLGGAHFIQSAGGQLADVTAQSLAGMAAGQSAAALSALGVPSIGSPARLPGVSSPLSSGPMQLQFTYVGSGNQVVDSLVGGLQVHIQGQYGGDVQAALGRGPVRVP